MHRQVLIEKLVRHVGEGRCNLANKLVESSITDHRERIEFVGELTDLFNIGPEHFSSDDPDDRPDIAPPILGLTDRGAAEFRRQTGKEPAPLD